MTQAVFDLPPSPPGWDDAAIPLVRIVDPLGDAIAWFAPDLSARCIGYAVRVAGGGDEVWRHVFHTVVPDRLLAGQEPYGCSVVATVPMHRARPAALVRFPGVFDLDAWRLVERDPTAAVFETALAPREPTPERWSRSGEVRLRLEARLADAALHLAVTARNDGGAAVPVGLGLRPAFATALFGGKPVSVLVRTAERAELLEAPKDGGLTLSGCDEGSEESPRAYLVAPHHGMHVALTLAAGIRHLAVAAPDQDPVVVLALLGDTPPAGINRLGVADRLRVAASIRLRVGAVDGAPDRARST